MEKITKTMQFMIKHTGRQIELTDEFKRCVTDEERVIFALNSLQKFALVPKSTGMPKNAKLSEELRKQGNEVYIKGSESTSYIEALKLYTKSIAFAPYPSRQLALAYANRSVVLIELQLYMECIQDIDRALSLDYPDNLKAKAYMRKVHCLLSMSDPSAREMITETEYWLEKMSSSNDKSKIRSKLNELHIKGEAMKITLCSLHNSTEEDKPEDKYFSAITSYNDEVPCASDAIVIKYNEHYGRHVVASRDINPGELIVIEKPYGLLLMKDKIHTHCSNCLRISWANIPCKFCTYAMYCSEECRDIEWEKCHDVECSVFPSLIEYKAINTDLFSLRLVVLAVKEAGSIQKLRAMLDECDKNDDPRTKGFSKEGKLHSDRYTSMYTLLRNTEKRTIGNLFGKSIDSSIILYFLATRTTMFGTKLPNNVEVLVKNRDVTFLGGLIMRNLQIISNNIHSFSEVQDLEFLHRGMAAMPLCSLINHSCNPNIFRLSTSKHMMLITTYPIREGEQILDNYGEHFALLSREKRQTKLREEYYFDCDCVPCQENWPLYDDINSYKILVKNAMDKDKIETTLKNLNTYISAAMSGDINNAPSVVDDLLKMIQVLYDHVPMPCVEMNIITETLKWLYGLNGNRFSVPKSSIS